MRRASAGGTARTTTPSSSASRLPRRSSTSSPETPAPEPPAADRSRRAAGPPGRRRPPRAPHRSRLAEPEPDAPPGPARGVRRRARPGPRRGHRRARGAARPGPPAGRPRPPGPRSAAGAVPGAGRQQRRPRGLPPSGDDERPRAASAPTPRRRRPRRRTTAASRRRCRPATAATVRRLARQRRPLLAAGRQRGCSGARCPVPECHASACHLTAARTGAGCRRGRAGRCSRRLVGRAATVAASTSLSRSMLAAKIAQDLLVGDALAGLDAGVEVGHDGDGRVAEGELAGDRRLGHAGHADDVAAQRRVPPRLGAGGEPGTVDHDEGAAVAAGASPPARGGDGGGPAARAVGVGERRRARPVRPRRRRCAPGPRCGRRPGRARPGVPGPSSGSSDPTAHGREHLPDAEGAQRPEVGAVVDPVRREAVVAAVPGEERDRPARHLARRAESRWADRTACRPGPRARLEQPGVEAGAAEDADLGAALAGRGKSSRRATLTTRARRGARDGPAVDEVTTRTRAVDDLRRPAPRTSTRSSSRRSPSSTRSVDVSAELRGSRRLDSAVLRRAVLRGPVLGRRTRARRRRRPAVGAVEAGALEDDPDGVEELAQLALALGALRQRGVAERLLHLEAVTARGARVGVRRHVVLLVGVVPQRSTTGTPTGGVPAVCPPQRASAHVTRALSVARGRRQPASLPPGADLAHAALRGGSARRRR